MKHWDITFGTIGATSTWVLSHYNEVAAGVAGTLTVAVMFIRLRKEWKHRND